MKRLPQAIAARLLELEQRAFVLAAEAQSLHADMQALRRMAGHIGGRSPVRNGGGSKTRRLIRVARLT